MEGPVKMDIYAQLKCGEILSVSIGELTEEEVSSNSSVIAEVLAEPQNSLTLEGDEGTLYIIPVREINWVTIRKGSGS